MQTSVVVIAHNEEGWIERCLISLIAQTKKPDEIVVVLHNCTDKTKNIAEKYPVKLIECLEQGSAIISRARGIEASPGDIVCCTDGDCWADKDWVKNISTPLLKKNISIVAGYTKIQNSIFWKFSCWWQFVIQRKVLNRKNHRFAWGSNFAFRKEDYLAVGGLLPYIRIHEDLKINYVAEDLYLSLALQQYGNIFYALKANIYTLMPPEKASIKVQRIIVPKQVDDNKKLFNYFNY